MDRGTAMNTALNHQLLRLSSLLQLEQRARDANIQELGFLMVNDTLTVVPYQQAVFWRGGKDGRVATVSGVAELESGGPYAAWLGKVLRHLAEGPRTAEMHALTASDQPQPLADEWSEWFPPNALWCPLTYPGGRMAGGLLFGRAEPWQDGEQEVMRTLCGAYAQSLALRETYRGAWARPAYPRLRSLLVYAAIALVVLALLPIRESVLAPAEIVPQNPFPVRAPFDGVIADIDVQPNAGVHAGQRLLTLDTQELRSHFQVASKGLDMAKAEYAEAAQLAMTDPKVEGKLAQLSAKVEQQQAEVDYDQGKLQRADVTAPIGGVAIYEDPINWIGKPVVLGERIMVVASPKDMALEAQVPVADVVTFKPGSEVQFFSNIAPDDPIRATLSFASYGSAMTVDGVLAHSFRARFPADDPNLRLGLKGTAKIYGERKPLALWALRKPITLIREWLSL